MSGNKAVATIIVVWFAMAVAITAIWGSILYIAVHFISKFW